MKKKSSQPITFPTCDVGGGGGGGVVVVGGAGTITVNL